MTYYILYVLFCFGFTDESRKRRGKAPASDGNPSVSVSLHLSPLPSLHPDRATVDRTLTFPPPPPGTSSESERTEGPNIRPLCFRSHSLNGFPDRQHRNEGVKGPTVPSLSEGCGSRPGVHPGRTPFRHYMSRIGKCRTPEKLRARPFSPDSKPDNPRRSTTDRNRTENTPTRPPFRSWTLERVFPNWSRWDIRYPTLRLRTSPSFTHTPSPFDTSRFSGPTGPGPQSYGQYWESEWKTLNPRAQGTDTSPTNFRKV